MRYIPLYSELPPHLQKKVLEAAPPNQPNGAIGRQNDRVIKLHHIHK